MRLPCCTFYRQGNGQLPLFVASVTRDTSIQAPLTLSAVRDPYHLVDTAIDMYARTVAEYL